MQRTVGLVDLLVAHRVLSLGFLICAIARGGHRSKILPMPEVRESVLYTGS